MTTFYLIMTLWIGGDVKAYALELEYIPFNTIEACEAAGKAWQKSLGKSEFRKAYYTCVAKGE